MKHLKEDSFRGNDATEYGKKMEPVARALVEDKLNKKIKECGFFIHSEHSYLGASPDGLVEGTDWIVEIICPFSLPRHKTLQACIQDKEKSVNFWKYGVGHLHYNHKFYYQVQGQLEVTGMDTCIFAVFKETQVGSGTNHAEIEIEFVRRDRDFWLEKMFPKLESFFFNCYLPELADSRIDRNLPVRAVNFSGQVVPSKEVIPKKVKKKEEDFAIVFTI